MAIDFMNDDQSITSWGGVAKDNGPSDQDRQRDTAKEIIQSDIDRIFENDDSELGIIENNLLANSASNSSEDFGSNNSHTEPISKHKSGTDVVASLDLRAKAKPSFDDAPIEQSESDFSDDSFGTEIDNDADELNEADASYAEQNQDSYTGLQTQDFSQTEPQDIWGDDTDNASSSLDVGSIINDASAQTQGYATTANFDTYEQNQNTIVYSNQYPDTSYNSQNSYQSQETSNVPEGYNQTYQTQAGSAQEFNQNISWEKYHKAWQDYYQKYYEYYFVQNSQHMQSEYGRFAKDAQEQLQASNAKISQLSQQLEDNPNFNPQDAALDQLRAKIRAEAVKQGRRFRRSKHFLPVVATLVVVLTFLFLQYNQLIAGQVMAYISPGNISPESLVVDPTASISVSEDPVLIIPSLHIQAPVAYDIPSDNESTLKAMENGLAHYCITGACAKPGQLGNVVISGHRTNGIYQTGDYKFIFLKLDHLKTGDLIYANYKGKRYIYAVTRSEVVDPSNTQSVVTDGTKPTMTLITCTPIGSDAQRLLVHAEQISPAPSEAKPAEVNEKPVTEEIPGQTKSFWETLFGG